MNPLEEFLVQAEGIKEEKEKTAGFLGKIWEGLKHGTRDVGRGSDFASRFGEALVPAMGVAAVGGTLAGGIEGYKAVKEKFTKTRDYKNMLEANPELKKMDAASTQMIYNSLRSTAPSLAGDPLVAGSFVRRVMDYGVESGPTIPLETTKMLTEAERNISQSRQKAPSSFMSQYSSGLSAGPSMYDRQYTEADYS